MWNTAATFFILREKTLYPNTIFSLISKGKNCVPPHTMFPHIKGKNSVPPHTIMLMKHLFTFNKQNTVKKVAITHGKKYIAT